jgi:hypothetical protein
VCPGAKKRKDMFTGKTQNGNENPKKAPRVALLILAQGNGDRDGKDPQESISICIT